MNLVGPEVLEDMAKLMANPEVKELTQKIEAFLKDEAQLVAGFQKQDVRSPTVR